MGPGWAAGVTGSKEQIATWGVRSQRVTGVTLGPERDPAITAPSREEPVSAAGDPRTLCPYLPGAPSEPSLPARVFVVFCLWGLLSSSHLAFWGLPRVPGLCKV